MTWDVRACDDHRWSTNSTGRCSSTRKKRSPSRRTSRRERPRTSGPTEHSGPVLVMLMICMTAVLVMIEHHPQELPLHLSHLPSLKCLSYALMLRGRPVLDMRGTQEEFWANAELTFSIRAPRASMFCWMMDMFSARPPSTWYHKDTRVLSSFMSWLRTTCAYLDEVGIV